MALPQANLCQKNLAMMIHRTPMKETRKMTARITTKEQVIQKNDQANITISRVTVTIE